MGSYIILNFEDKIDDEARGAAFSTVAGLSRRYQQIKQPTGVKRLLLGTNSVSEYRCVEPGNPPALMNDNNRLAALKEACGAAKKIYIVAHGDPRHTDVCFTNGNGSTVVQLATAPQLAAFLAPRLAGSHEHRLSLVMCYGARARDYRSSQVHHQGMIPQQHLVTSFAYKLFYALVHDHGVKVQLSAVTGKIAHDSTSGRAMIEHEDMIDVDMEIAEAEGAKKASAQAAGFDLLKPGTDDYKARYQPWKASPEGAALNKAASDLRGQKSQIVQNLVQAKQDTAMHHYGKLVYLFKNSALTILSKYGDDGQGVKPGTALYKGPLLAPG